MAIEKVEKTPSLALFFTRGVSLRLWIESGLFDREKLLYEEHLNRGILSQVYFLTYGSGDFIYSETFKKKGLLHQNIQIVPMPKIFNGKIGNLIYSFLMPIIKFKIIKTVCILKTNQIDGSWSAVIAKWLFGKVLIVRTGFTYSQLQPSLNKNSIKNIFYKVFERFAYQFSDIGIVSSVHSKNYLIEKNGIDKNRIKVLNSYVNTDVFRPIPVKKKYKNRIISVGRLTKVKNISSLIKATHDLNLTLDIFGDGLIKNELELKAKQLNACVNFNGMIPNNELPAIFNHYMYYVIPSIFEGMPKALLEAMACGLVCIGTDIGGIGEVIQNGIDGYLTDGVDSKSIAGTLVLAMENDNTEIISNAVKKIKNEYSLNNIIKKEQKLFETLIKCKQDTTNR